MSEPRKLNTDHSLQQYEAARRQAQQQSAVRGGRRARRIQTDNVHPVTPEEQARLAAAAQPGAETPPAPEPTRARQQAAALQRAAEQRRDREASAPVLQQLDLSRTQPGKAMYDMDNDPAFAEHQRQRAARQQAPAAPAAARRPAPVQRTRPAPAPQPREAAPRTRPAPAPVQRREEAPEIPPQAAEANPQPPRPKKPAPAQPNAKKAGGGSGGKPPKGRAPAKKDGKKKKKGGWWKILLVTLLVLGLIVFGAFTVIMQALKPETGGNITLNQLLNTPKEYADKEFNVLLVGIDRSTESADNPDKEVNDGMTDMIMWLHFNNETGEVKMLQIPRNIFVSTDGSFAGNYQINSIAKTQGSGGYNNMNALCTYVSDAFQVSIDGYITIRLEKLVELVDLIGGVQINVPFDMDDGTGSRLNAGYQTLDGPACEFFLRTRHIYADQDLGRLNMQRYFYAAMFAKLRAMSMWDIAKNLPFYLSMVDTSLDASELVSVAVSLLKVSSENIMLSQVPVYMGNIIYNSNDVVVVARQETADLLNTYYRENSGPVEAAALNVCDNVLDISGRSPSDPSVQFMGDLNAEIAEAQQNDNLDGSGTQIGAGEYVYDVPPEEAPAGEEGGESGAAEPAA